MVVSIPFFSLTVTSCGDDDDEPSLPSGITTDKQEAFIACLDTNFGELPSRATTLYEDNEYKYLVAARSPKYELILLPYYKQDGEWVAAYKYKSSNDVGKQLTPIEHNGGWLCSLRTYTNNSGVVSLEAITGKMNFESQSYLSVTPFNYHGCYYGYLTVENNKKVHLKIFCSTLNLNRTQGSPTFGYISSAKLEYQFY